MNKAEASAILTSSATDGDKVKTFTLKHTNDEIYQVF